MVYLEGEGQRGRVSEENINFSLKAMVFFSREGGASMEGRIISDDYDDEDADDDNDNHIYNHKED